ncbi:MAG TPA: 50S ribosomal protein L3 [Pirellulales bacterium]|jgi:large subunit ribosomal protein L3|nr:50S ribosomal protein L3 [Pirellulales bacterium]
MTQIFDEAGAAIPVTVVEAGPCHVLQLRTKDRDGYEAVQLGYLDKPRRLASRAQRGQVARLDSKRAKAQAKAGVEPLAKADCEPKRFVGELRGPIEGFSVGQLLKVDIFKEITAVDVTGTSKGRGTSGVMRRHNFKGQRATHGVKKVHRHGGGTSMNTFPARVFKGKRMAGRYGNERTTNRNLKLVRIDSEHNLLLIRGAVPGPNGGYVFVKQSNKM